MKSNIVSEKKGKISSEDENSLGKTSPDFGSDLYSRTNHSQKLENFSEWKTKLDLIFSPFFENFHKVENKNRNFIKKLVSQNEVKMFFSICRSFFFVYVSTTCVD